MTNPPMQPPPGWAAPAQGYAQDGPPGRVRPTGTGVLLFVVTLGIYQLVYNYRVHDEMKRHSGRGIGGGIALLLTFLAGIAMPFLTPHEVGNLYERKRQPPPVRALTGLWLLVPTVFGYLLMIVGVVGLAASTSRDPVTGRSSDPSTGSVVFLVAAVAFTLVTTLAGSLVWFVKTNGALNRYWEQLARPASAPAAQGPTGTP